jgi:PAS domain S-box-containing protein
MELDHQGPVLQVERAAELTAEAVAKAGAAIEELQRASMTATMIARVATAVAQSADISELAEAVLDQTIDALGAYACSIFTADTEHRTLHRLSSRRTPEHEVFSTVPFDGPSVTSRAARMRQVQVVDDLERIIDEKPPVAEFLAGIGARRISSAPLLAGGELVGVLTYVITSPRACCADVTAILEVLASIVGVGLSNVQAKDRAKREHARLQTILEHAPHGIVYVDLVEQRTTSNPAADKLLGMSLSELTATSDAPVRIFYPDGRRVEHDDVPGMRALRGETVKHVELQVERPTGERRPVLLSATPVTGKGGRVEGTVIAFEDISALKELERLREEFAAIVAHDLRNPITAIRATADVILMKARDGDRLQVERSGIERIRHSSVRLDDMVKDLMDASRIEAGRLGLQAAPIEAADVVTSFVSQILPTLGSHAVELDVDGGHVRINADRLRLEQILTNIVENAAKYSPEQAPIAVRVRQRDGGVAISVADHGSGIAPEEMPLLFDRFYQAQRARAMRKGLGLGLYITKGLVEAHGGRITVHSEVGNGSTFEVWLPAAA